MVTRRIYILFVCLFAFTSFSNTSYGQTSTEAKIIDCRSLEEKFDVWLLYSKPYSGPCHTFHPNGKKSSEAVFQNGRIHGVLKMFYKSGRLSETVVYENGIPDGKVVYYYDSNQVSETGMVLNEEKSGEWKTYYENGQLKAIENYLNGELHGPTKAYTEKGMLQMEGNFKNGLQDGIWTFYDPKTGKKDGTLEYRNGKPKEN